MPGSSASIAEANITINTAVAKELAEFADYLEKADDFFAALHDLIKKTVSEHKRIIFNGNGYDAAWIKESARRGLLNLPTTPDCLKYMLSEKNKKLFTDFKVLSETEFKARYDVALENYIKTLKIEATTMKEMANRDILPAVSEFSSELASAVAVKKQAGLNCAFEEARAKQVCDLEAEIFGATETLTDAMNDLPNKSLADTADYYKDKILPTMNKLRSAVDDIETILPADKYPYPTYGELLFGICKK